MAIAAGTKRVVIAIPQVVTDAKYTYGKELTSVIDVDGMGLDVKDNFSTKLASYTMPCAVESGRIFKEFKNFIVEINSGKLLAKNNGGIYETNGERFYFV